MNETHVLCAYFLHENIFFNFFSQPFKKMQMCINSGTSFQPFTFQHGRCGGAVVRAFAWHAEWWVFELQTLMLKKR